MELITVEDIWQAAQKFLFVSSAGGGVFRDGGGKT